jgi:peptide/nickel transport system substrate-binding protein
MRCGRWSAVAVAVGATVVAACGGDGGSDRASRAGTSEPLAVVGPFELHSLDPSTAGGLFTRLQVAETLVDADPDGVLQPGLASAWEASPDGLNWQFALRDGATFHDGAEVTAEAVAASLERSQASAESLLAAAPVAAIEADDDAVQIELDEPYAPPARGARPHQHPGPRPVVLRRRRCRHRGGRLRPLRR